MGEENVSATKGGVPSFMFKPSGEWGGTSSGPLRSLFVSSLRAYNIDPCTWVAMVDRYFNDTKLWGDAKMSRSKISSSKNNLATGLNKPELTANIFVQAMAIIAHAQDIPVDLVFSVGFKPVDNPKDKPYDQFSVLLVSSNHKTKKTI